jgi:hypothetical protein
MCKEVLPIPFDKLRTKPFDVLRITPPYVILSEAKDPYDDVF